MKSLYVKKSGARLVELATWSFILLNIGCICYVMRRINRILILGYFLFAILGIGLLCPTYFAYKKTKNKLSCNSLLFALMAAFWSFSLNEACIGSLFVKTYIPYTVIGYSFYAGVYLLGAILLTNPKLYFCIFEGLFASYGLAQYFLMEFRGAPIKISDLQNIRSALEIKSEYSFRPSFLVIVVIIQLISMIYITTRLELKYKNIKMRFVALGGTIFSVISVGLFSSYTYQYGIDSRLIRLNFSGEEDIYSFQQVGNLLMFYYDGIYNRVKEPEGYSPDKAKEILEQYSLDDSIVNKPIIIAILNESWADFSHLGNISVNKDYLPYWRSLKSNAVKGYVTVSPYGGYTCNSEYEFLTGNSMHFMPLGTAAFTNYLEHKEDSIVTYLNHIGYETVAFTPCDKELWDIGNAYEKLGFTKTYFGEETGIDFSDSYNNQPSDRAVFKGLDKIIEDRDKEKGLFVWVTTMQNHASYTTDVDGGVILETPYDEAAERYLNCVYQSDKSLGELIEKYENFEDDVIVVMFGDHFPHIEGYAEKLYGKNLTGLNTSDYALVHQTPYVIWSNKEMAFKEDNNISLNYLANETFLAAGLPLSPVQQELEYIRKDIPIISSFGVRTQDGEWYDRNNIPSKYDDIITEYSIVQYYRMF